MPSILGYSQSDADFYLFNAFVDTNPAGRGYDATIIKALLSRRSQAPSAEMFRAYLTDQNWGGAARSDLRVQMSWRIDCPGTTHGVGDLLLITDITGGNPLYRISRQSGAVGNSDYALWYWSGSAWVMVGAYVSIPNATLHTSTITIKMADSGGVLQWHLNGALMAQLVGDTKFTASTTFDCVQWWTPGVGGSGWGTHVDVAEIIMASYDYMTYGLRVADGTITGAGTYADQTNGAYTDVDDVTLNTGDGITFDTAAQKATFAFSDLPSVIAAAPIMEVRVMANLRRGASGPQQVRLLLLQTAGMEQSAIIPVNGIGFTTVAARFPTDYNGNAFSAAVYNAAEAGVQAET